MSAPHKGANGPLRRWVEFVAGNPKRVLLGALVATVAFGVLAGVLRGEFADSFTLPDAESQRAYDLLDERFPQRSGSSATLVFRSTADGGIASETSATEIQALLDTVKTLPHVAGVDSPLEFPHQISAGGDIAYATVNYDALSNEVPIADAEKLVAAADAANSDTLQVEAGGEIVALTEQEFGGTAELIGIGAAIIILLIAFGSVVAMGVPIVMALIGLALGFMGIGIATGFLDIATFAPAFASMIGIGVGIDYSLFIVTRFREGLTAGLDPREATIRALDTSGRAVLFAGAVVVISMLGLSVVGIPFVTALGLAAAIVVASAVLVAFVFLPAMLVLIGRRIDKWSVHRPGSRTGDGVPVGRRLSNRIQARPALYAAVSAGLLLVLAIPVIDVDLGFPDASTNPPDFHTRQAYELLTEGFGAGFSNPLILVVEDESGIQQETLDRIAADVAAAEGIIQVDQPFVNDAGDTAVITVMPASSANDGATQDLVQNLRDTTLPAALEGSGAQVFVGGPTGSFLDFFEHMENRTPYVFVVIIGLSFLLLTIVFRSPVIAIKAAVMNILSISAAFGVVIAIFQWGWAASLFGIDEKQPIAVFMPMFLFAILFGLSMDYEVFLLSRIREFWVHGRNTSEAVADGLAVTARVITAAAAIMVAVFLAFVATPDPITKQFGLGLAVAIFIDASIVRLVLVPATMELLGEWNWWFPQRLERLVPRIHIEGTHDPIADLESVGGVAD